MVGKSSDNHGNMSRLILGSPESPLFTFFSHFWLVFFKKLQNLDKIFVKNAKYSNSVRHAGDMSFKRKQINVDKYNTHVLTIFSQKILVFGIYWNLLSFWWLNYVKNWHSVELKISRLQYYCLLPKYYWITHEEKIYKSKIESI